MKARYQSGKEGRFWSQDPVFWEVGNSGDGFKILLNPQAQNSYGYTNGNPVVNKDPSGRISTEALLARPIRTLAQAGLWSIGSYLLGNYDIIGHKRPVSNALMMKSLSLNPDDLSIDESNQFQYGNIVDSLKDSGYLNSVIDKALKNNNEEIFSDEGFKTNNLNFNKQGGDLFTAIGKANLTLKGDKKTGEVGVSVSDTYNYEYNNNGYSESKIFTTLNNFATLSQKAGVISQYNYSVNYKINVKKE